MKKDSFPESIHEFVNDIPSLKRFVAQIEATGVLDKIHEVKEPFLALAEGKGTPTQQLQIVGVLSALVYYQLVQIQMVEDMVLASLPVEGKPN